MSNLKFIDMFAGMGTARMGFEQAGWECVYSIEWDKHKRKIYEVIFGNEPEGKDIRECSGTAIPLADCWVFGFPCQDISVAGKQAGFKGSRSSLYFQVMRLLQEIQEEDRPEWLLAENVKNFLSINGGWDFFKAISAMDALGYDVEWQLINSKAYVPQNRERVFLVGHLRKYGRREIFSCSGEGGEIAAPNCEQLTTGDGIAYCIDANYHKGISNIEHAQRTHVKQIGNLYPENNRNPEIGRVYDTEGISPCLNTMQGGQRQPKIVMPCLTPNRPEKRQNGRRFKNDGEPMFTITKQDIHGVLINDGDTNQERHETGLSDSDGERHYQSAIPRQQDTPGRVQQGWAGTLETGCNQGVMVVPKIGGTVEAHEGDGIICSRSHQTFAPVIRQTSHCLRSGNARDCGVVQNMRIRRLTPRECMRLQGVPDEITDKLIAAGISDTQMYRAAGDACTVDVVYAIAESMRRCMENEQAESRD